jgi:hypothetical protein
VSDCSDGRGIKSLLSFIFAGEISLRKGLFEVSVAAFLHERSTFYFQMSNNVVSIIKIIYLDIRSVLYCMRQRKRALSFNRHIRYFLIDTRNNAGGYPDQHSESAGTALKESLF